jgi:hypothetical protein
MDITPEGYRFLVKYLGLSPFSNKDRFATFEKPLLKKIAKLPEGSPEREILDGMLADIRDKADAKNYTPDSDMEKLAHAVDQAIKDRKDGKGSTDFVIVLQSAKMPEEIQKSMKDGEAMGLVKVAMVQCATAFIGPEKAIALLKAKLKIENGGLDFDAPFRLSDELATLMSDSGTALFVDFRSTAQTHATLVRDQSEQAPEILDLLKDGLTDHVKGIEAKCKTLVEKINGIMNNPGQLKTTIAEVESDNAALARRQAWDDLRVQADETIRQLEWWSDPAAAGLRQRHSALTAPTGDGAADKLAIAAAQTLVNDAKKQVVTTQGAFDKERKKIEGELEQVEKRLKVVAVEYGLDMTGIGGVGDSGVMKLNGELLDKCGGEVKAIKSILGDGANMGSLTAARDLLKSITTALDQRRDAEATGKTDMLTFLIDACGRRLTDSTIKKYMPEGLAALQKTYDEVASKAVGKPVDQQIADYQSVKDKLQKLQEDAESRSGKLKTFEQSKKSAREALGKIAKGLENEGPKDKPGSDDKDFYKKYHGPLATRLASAVDLAQSETLTEVDEAVKLIGEVVADCIKILTAMKTKKESRTQEQSNSIMQAIEGQIVGISEKRKREEDEATFKDAYKAFKLMVDNAVDRADGKPEIVNEIKGYGTMGKNAKDMFESDHDLARAQAVLDKAKKSIDGALRKLKVRPSDLAKISNEWEKACGSLETQLTKLAEAAAAAVKDLPDDSDLKEAAGEVKQQFLAAAKPFKSAPGFAKAQKIYEKEGVQPSELKVAREAVLQQVRLLVERLSNDPVIRAAQANPFGQANVVAPLYARLRSIEMKALVTV